jgi:hypothetical protein
MYTHYVVVHDWAVEEDEGVTILGVTHTYEDAKAIFNKHRLDELHFAEEHEYDIETDENDRFDAGVMGYWRTEHTTLYIQGVM